MLNSTNNNKKPSQDSLTCSSTKPWRPLSGRSEFVQIFAKRRDLNLGVLALTDGQQQVVQLCSSRIISTHVKILPMVKDALREVLSAGLLAQSRHEAERLGNWKVRLDLYERRSLTRILFEDATATKVHACIDATHGILWARDLHQKDWFLKCRVRKHFGSETTTARRRHDLASAAVDGVGVERNILNVESDATHILLCKGALLGRPLEGTVHMLLDFV